MRHSMLAMILLVGPTSMARAGALQTSRLIDSRATEHNLRAQTHNCRIGIRLQSINEELARHYGLDAGDGVLVSDVESRSPASRAGLRQEDIILSFDHIKIKTLDDFFSQLGKIHPGQTLELGIWRARVLVKVHVTAEAKAE